MDFVAQNSDIFRRKILDNPHAKAFGGILPQVDMIMVSKRNGGARMVTTIRLPEELHKKLKTEARAKGMTLNGLVVWVLWEWVRR